MDRFPGARRLNRSGLFLAASAAGLCLPIAAFAQTNVTIGGGTATGGASNNTTSGVVIGEGALLQSDSGPLGDMPDVVIGAGAVSTGSQAILGPTGVVIGGGPNTVVGAAAEALNATDSLVLGAAAHLEAPDGTLIEGATVVGQGAGVSGSQGVAVGASAIAATSGAALGTAANAGASRAVAIGLCANAGCEVDPDGGVSLAPATVGVGSVAIGAFSNSAGDQSIALGQSALSSGPGSVALGSAARASGAGSVVLGAGSTDGGEVDVVSVGATGAERKIINVATGALSATSTEAVNGSQLYATNTRQATIGASVSAALGGGAIYDPVTGSIGAPSYTVQSATYDNIGGAIGALDAGLSATNATVANLSSEVAAGNAGPVRRTGAPNQVALVADGGTAASPGAAQVLTNVAAGDVSATSSEAVNGSQIYATNTRQAAVGASISAVLGGGATYDPATGSIGAPSYTVQSATYDNIGGAIGALDSGLSATNTTVANLSNEVASGNAGPVRRTGALNQVTLVADGGTAASPGAAQILTNVAAGDVSATSSDAVNGSQLYATNKAVSTLAGSVDNGTVGTVQRTPGAPNQLTLTAPGAAAVSPGAPQALTNVAPGRISPGSLDAVNGSQLYASQGATLAHAKAYTDVVGSQLSKEIHALGARDAALASLPQAVIPGRSTFSMALGVDQTTAVAAAYSRVFDDRYATALKASIAAAPVTGDVSAGVGIGWSF